MTPSLLRGWPLPSPAGDKEAKGRLLVIGGSDTTPGAARLAAEAALRVGAGKVQIATTASTAAHLATAVPESLVVGLPAKDGELAVSAAQRLVDLAAGADAVLVGPGMGDPEATCALLEAIVPGLDTALVVDALGTAYLTAHPQGLRHLAQRALLTPNVTELAQVLREGEEEVAADVLGAAVRAARRTGVTVLAGADDTYVVQPSGEAWVIRRGAAGAAVAGSGDVKAGAVAGLVARGATPAQAGAWGGFLHGRAAELLTASVGTVGFLAREIVTRLPAALGEVEA